MSDFIDTREGWREVSAFEYQPHSAPKIAVMEDDGETRYWVRDAPVPPLPTAPYTVIRVTWKADVEAACEAMCDENGDWWVPSEHSIVTATDLAPDIHSFKVLSEPRAVTAKAVINRFVELREQHAFTDAAVIELAHEFGVES